MNLDYVKFDVGHYYYLAHKNTILKYEDSVLAKYISAEFDCRKSGDDYIFIDRDGKYFGKILNYLRDESSLDLSSWKDSDVVDLMREADYYCLMRLVELCEQHLEIKSAGREVVRTDFKPSEKHKLEIIYDLNTLKELLDSSDRKTIVISYRTMRKLSIDSWIEELVELCDYSRFRMVCYGSKGDTEKTCDPNLINSIMSLYNPDEKTFAPSLRAPEYYKFREKKMYYKCKVFKFCLSIQNGWTSPRHSPQNSTRTRDCNEVTSSGL